MGVTEITNAIGNYLDLGVAQGALPSVSTVDRTTPKTTKETDFFDEQTPGSPDGAVIFMWFAPHGEERIALGGYTNGRKAVGYKLSLICPFRWKGPRTEDAEAANKAFTDGLVAWIRANRNAGTQAVSLGGDGTGVVFSWGEGPLAGIGSGGSDITVSSGQPKTIRGQTSQVFNVIDVDVIEIVVS